MYLSTDDGFLDRKVLMGCENSSGVVSVKSFFISRSMNDPLWSEWMPSKKARRPHPVMKGVRWADIRMKSMRFVPLE